MKLKITILSLSVLALTACNSGSGSGGNGNKEDLRAAAKAAPALTKEQKQQLVEMIKADKAIRPHIDLYFDKYEKPEIRTRDLNVLNDEGRGLLSKVKTNCEISPEKETTTGTYDVGQIQTVEKVKSIKGNSCPIDYSYKETTVNQMISGDKANRIVTSVSRKTTDSVSNILDPELKNKLFATDSKVHEEQEIHLNNYKFDKNLKFISGQVQGTFRSNFSALSKKGTPITGSSITTIDLTPTEKNIEALVKMNIPENIILVIGIFVTNDNIELIVNGQNYTMEEFNREFNDAIDIPDLKTIGQ